MIVNVLTSYMRNSYSGAPGLHMAVVRAGVAPNLPAGHGCSSGEVLPVVYSHLRGSRQFERAIGVCVCACVCACVVRNREEGGGRKREVQK